MYIPIYTVSDKSFKSYTDGAKQKTQWNKELLSLKLSAIIHNAGDVTVGIQSVRTYRFGSFSLIVDEEKFEVQDVFWDEDRSFPLSTAIGQSLRESYYQLGLNPNGNGYLVEKGEQGA